MLLRIIYKIFSFSSLSKHTTSEGLQEAFSKFGEVLHAIGCLSLAMHETSKQ